MIDNNILEKAHVELFSFFLIRLYIYILDFYILDIKIKHSFASIIILCK